MPSHKDLEIEKLKELFDINTPEHQNLNSSFAQTSK